MTDLIKDEVITDKKGNHYRYVGLEDDEPASIKLCEELVELGYFPASFQRKDNSKFEVFVRFSLAEEILWILERQYCDNCERPKEDCYPETCNVKASIEDALWKERLGPKFQSLLIFKLKFLKEKEGETK